jgi:hypothetical protein
MLFCLTLKIVKGFFKSLVIYNIYFTWQDEGVCSSETSFRCPEGRCLSLAKRCDGYKDCLDGSDEILCRKIFLEKKIK